MKRHPVFVPLSRDHHEALILGQGLRPDGPPTLRDALPAEPAARARHVLDFFRDRLAPHFTVEEETVLPRLEGRDAELDAEIANVREDHAALRALIEALDTSEDPEPILVAFGERLVKHVRSEERGLFERAQRVLGDEGLTDLFGGPPAGKNG